MISISNFVPVQQLKNVLQTLPINKFQIREGIASNPDTFESSDVVIANVKQAKALQKHLEKNQIALILYIDATDIVSNTYQAAKEFRAFAMISTADFKKIDEIIDAAYAAILEKRKQQFGQGKTIGVFGLKGGVGKSFLSYHLISGLANFTKSESLLVDAGVPFGSAHTLLNIQSKSSWQVLRPLLKTGKDLTMSRLNAQIIKTSFQFQLLGAPQTLNEDVLSAPELSHLLDGVKQSYPLTVVDMPNFPAAELTEYAKLFDLVIWVFTPDANSIVQTVESIQHVQKTLSEQSTLLVCNMTEPSVDQPLVHSLAQKLAPVRILTIDADSEAVKIHQRKFELLSDDSLLLTKQLKELAQAVFFKLSEK